VDAWLTSRQFKKLQHLEFYHYYANSFPPSVVVVPSPPCPSHGFPPLSTPPPWPSAI
jgi:hypothetical protein